MKVMKILELFVSVAFCKQIRFASQTTDLDSLSAIQTTLEAVTAEAWARTLRDCDRRCGNLRGAGPGRFE
jgi:hypothetical protein